MIRTLAIILLALSTAGSGFFGWKQWTAGQNAGQQIAELTGKVEEASKAQEAAQEELSTAQSQIDPLKSKLQELDAVKAAFSTGVVLKDLEAAYAKEKKLSAERQLGLAGVRLLTKGTKDPGTVDAFQKALEMTDWKGQPLLVKKMPKKRPPRVRPKKHLVKAIKKALRKKSMPRLTFMPLIGIMKAQWGLRIGAKNFQPVAKANHKHL
jgi:chromosome segregation ATPase